MTAKSGKRRPHAEAPPGDESGGNPTKKRQLSKEDLEQHAAMRERWWSIVEELGLTQADLTRIMDITSATANAYYHRGIVPDTIRLARFCKRVRRNGHWILTGEGPKMALGFDKTPQDEAATMGQSIIMRDVMNAIQNIARNYSVDATLAAPADTLPGSGRTPVQRPRWPASR